MYDQHVTREQQGKALAHLSAVSDAPQTNSRTGAAHGVCEKPIEDNAFPVPGDESVAAAVGNPEVVPVDAGAAYVSPISAAAVEIDDDAVDLEDDELRDEFPVREKVVPALSLIAGFDQMFEEIEDQWQERALCAQTDPEAFFPEKGGSTREAKRICLGCEVKDECLEYALAKDERFGIWGGLSERERRRLKRGIV